MGYLLANIEALKDQGEELKLYLLKHPNIRVVVLSYTKMASGMYSNSFFSCLWVSYDLVI